MSVETNLNNVRDRIYRAAERAGRDAGDIRLVVVTKTVCVEKIKKVVDCGVEIIGESRVHEALAKQPEIGRAVEWHMVGHLQSRKAARAVELFDMVQSVESISTAGALQKRCASAGHSMRILIEVNTSQEDEKYGIHPRRVDSFIGEIAHMENLQVEGLMTMAAFVPDPELARPSFRQLRELAEELRRNRTTDGPRFDVLSMGMSNDFEVAIEEGSTMVRIGTAIFEE